MKKLILILLLAGCATQPTDVYTYLKEANAGLPREVAPFMVEEVVLENKTISTVMTFNRPEQSMGARAYEIKFVEQSTTKEFYRICNSNGFQHLVNQGYKFQLRSINVRENSVASTVEVKPKDCN